MSPALRDRIAVLLVGAVLFLPGLAANDLWNPDEPRYAEIAREMGEPSSPAALFVPRLNGEIYTEKPPLLFWAILGAAWLRGALDEFAVRLPVALSAVFALALTFELGRAWVGRRAGWLAAAVFGTCLNVMLQARSAQIDMLLVACVAAAVYAWTVAYRTGRPGLYRLFFVAAGLATVAKGPVGLLPPLLSVVAFLVLARRWDELRRMRIPTGLLLWAAVVLLWLVPAAAVGGEAYWRPILFLQNVQRFAEPWGHIRPWHYYLTALPATFLPWFVLIPGAAIHGWRRMRGAEREGWLFGMTWMVVTVLFFSVSAGKRTVYILTMYPGMALWIGAALDHLASATRPSRLAWATPFAAVALAGTLGATAPLWYGLPDDLAVLGPRFPRLAAATLAVLAVAAAAAAWCAWRRKIVAAVGALAIGCAVAGLAIVLWLRPPFDAIKSARGLSAELVARAAPGEPYALYPRIEPGFLFYTGRLATVCRTPEELRDFLAGPGRRWVFARKDALAALDPAPALREVARDADRRRGHVLLLSE